MNLRRWSLVPLLLLVLPMLALLALVVVDVFDTRLFRTFVAPRIEERLERNVQIAELDLRWGLPLEFSIANLQLANAAWGRAPAMLKVPEATMTFDPMQWFSGGTYAHVELREPRITMETSEQGAFNWKFDTQASPARMDDQATLPVSLRSEGGEIQYRDHRDGTSLNVPLEVLTLQPQSEGAADSDPGMFRGTLLASYQEVLISLESLVSKKPDGWHANVMLDVGDSHLEGTLEADSSGMPLKLRADLRSSKVDVDRIIALLPAENTGEKASLEVSELRRVDIAATLAVAELRLLDRVFTDSVATASSQGARLHLEMKTQLGSAAFETVLRIDGGAPEPVLQAELTLHESPAAILLETLGLAATPGQISGHLIAALPAIDGELRLVPETLLATLRVPQAELYYRRGGLQMSVQAEVAMSGAEPVVDMKVISTTSETIEAHLTGAPLRELLAGGAYPVMASIQAPAADAELSMDLRTISPTGNFTLDIAAMGTELPALPTLGFSPPALPEFSLEGQLRKTEASWSLTNAYVKLGPTGVSGDMSWEPSREPDYLQANLDADVIDLPALLKLAESQFGTGSTALSPPGAPQSDVAFAEQAVLPALLGSVDMDVSLMIGRLMLPQALVATDVQMEAGLHDRVLQVAPLRLETAAGAISGTMTADASSLPSSIRLALEFDALRPSRFASAFPALDPLTNPYSGNLELKLSEISPENSSEVSRESSLASSTSTTKLPLVGRVALQDFRLDISTPRGETDLSLALGTTGTAEANSSALPLRIDGRLLGVPMSGDLHAYRDGQLALRNLTAQVGASDFSGSVLYTPGADGAYSIEAMLHSSQLDAGDLWTRLQQAPEPLAEDNAADADAAADVLPRGEFDLQFLRTLNSEVSYTADELIVADSAQGRLDVEFTAQNGNLTLDPVYLGLAGGGELRVQGDLQVVQSSLQGSLQAEARRFDLGALLAGTGFVKDGAGLLGGQAKFWMRGDSLSALLGSLDGGLMLMLSGAQLDPVLVEAAGLDVGEAVLAAAGLDDAIPVNCAYASAYARSGVLMTEHVVVDTPDSTFYLTGEVDLQAETLDLALHNETKDFAIVASESPIALRGTFSAPEVVLLTDELIADAAVSAGLAILATPAAALLAFVDADETAQVAPVCRGWVNELREVL